MWLINSLLTSALSTAVAPQDDGPSCGASLAAANSGVQINASNSAQCIIYKSLVPVPMINIKQLILISCIVNAGRIWNRLIKPLNCTVIHVHVHLSTEAHESINVTWYTSHANYIFYMSPQR